MYIMSLKASKALMRVWTKRGGDCGLSYYSLTQLSIAVNNVLHRCVIRLSSVLLAANFLSKLVVDGISETRMPCKLNYWGTFVRKSNFYKSPLANYRALRPVHSLQTRSQFLSLP